MMIFCVSILAVCGLVALVLYRGATEKGFSLIDGQRDLYLNWKRRRLP